MRAYILRRGEGAPTRAQQFAALDATIRAARELDGSYARGGHNLLSSASAEALAASGHAADLGVYPTLDSWGLPWCLGECAGDGLRVVVDKTGRYVAIDGERCFDGLQWVADGRHYTEAELLSAIGEKNMAEACAMPPGSTSWCWPLNCRIRRYA